MSDHPTREELSALAQGKLPPKRALEVTLHFVDGCPSCHPVLLPALDRPGAAAAAESGGYDEVVQRVFRTALRRRESYGRERDRVRKIVAELTAGGPEALSGIERRETGAPLVEALLERSWSLRWKDPRAMLEHARLATAAAAELDLGPEGAARVADLRCRAWAEHGNALRITDDLDGAQEAFDTALGYWTAGTRDETLFARYLDLRASLHRARRELGPAQADLAVACAIYLDYGQLHLAGRNLLSQALFASAAGESDAALRLVEKCLSLIDESRDAELVAAAVYNQIWFLADAGRYAEASGLVLEAAEAFTALRIHREMLMAVLYLKETFVCGSAEVPLLEEVCAFLRRAEHDASAR